MQSYPIKKNCFQHTADAASHRNKTNVQLQILSAKTYCELAVKQLFFKKYQSCVWCTVTLSHRFKAFWPAFCRQNRFRHVPPENFAKSLPTELWIVPRSPEVRKPLACFLVLFARCKKNVKTSPFAGNFEVLQTSKQRTAMAASHRNN